MITPMFSLDGRVALVTGGNSGIGRELALALRDAGAKVAIGARRADRNAEVLAELGGDCAAFQLDVSDEASIEKVMAGIADRFGRLDILINNAGTVNRKSVMELGRTEWDQVMNVNVTGPFLCTRHAARMMKTRGSGKILSIASIWGLTALSKSLQVSYTVSKHAIIGLTKVNAVELGQYGIQVNAFAPGYYLTEMTAELSGTPMEQAIMRRTPSGKTGRDERPDRDMFIFRVGSVRSCHRRVYSRRRRLHGIGRHGSGLIRTGNSPEFRRYETLSSIKIRVS